jgi:CRISPR-associated protein Cas1
VPARLDPAARFPEHWRRAGPRLSGADHKRPRKAQTPAHALVNYAYAILETEATIAAHAMGFDPSLGIILADTRYRGSLVADLVEPVRPIVDELVLDLLERCELRRGDLFETREGVCRLGPPLIGELAELSPIVRRELAPYAEQLARVLLQDPSHATPLTRERHPNTRSR